MIVNYKIYGNDEVVLENNTSCSFFTQSSLTANNIRNLFPYEGVFHFRAKVTGSSVGLPDFEYVWLDLIDDNELIPVTGKILEIRVIIIQINGHDVDEYNDYEEYLEEVNQELGVTPYERPERYPIKSPSTNDTESSTSKVINKLIPKGMQKMTKAVAQNSFQTVSSGVSSLWNNIKASAQTFMQQPSLLSDTSEERLAELSEDLSATYEDHNSEHSKLMKEMFNVMFPQKPYTRNSLIWKEGGWQKADPVADLKASGILALKAITYFCRTKQSIALAMIERNKQNIKTNYPFAIVAVNITLLLGEILNLRDQQYLMMQANYWELFEDRVAFYEVFSTCIVYVDHIWKTNNLTRSDFSKLIGETKNKVSSVLQKGPKSVNDFQLISLEVGLAV